MSAAGRECKTPLKPGDAAKNIIVPHGARFDRTARDYMWMWAVSLYSAMNLTCDDDTLPGLSGLASSIQTLHPDQYLAGFWRSSLTTQLLWYRPRPRCTPAKYLAPSWSWASNVVGGEGAKFVWVSNLQPLARILEAHCIPTYDSDPTGMVSSGYVRLAAISNPGKLRFDGSAYRGLQSTCDFRGRREYVHMDLTPEPDELNVRVVAIGHNRKSYFTRILHYLILSSNGGHPETYRRQGYLKFVRSFQREWFKTIVQGRAVELVDVGFRRRVD